MEVTIKLLENAMKDFLKEPRDGEAWADGKGRFLIDGFPRKMDQALKFDETVCVVDELFSTYIYSFSKGLRGISRSFLFLHPRGYASQTS